MKFRIPLFWTPSVLVLEVEEALLSKISCPRCGGKMEKTSNTKLEGGGDLVSLFCPSCGRRLEVKFVFTGPRLDENPDLLFDTAFRHLLESCQGEEFRNRLREIHREMAEHGWGGYVERRLKEDLTRYRLQGESDPRARAKAKKISEYLQASVLNR